MKEITIRVPETKYSFFHELIKELGLKEETTAKSTRSLLKKDMEQAVHEMNLVKKGKLKARPAKELLNEL